MVNDARALIEGRLEEAKTALAQKAREEQLRKEVIDVTLPAKRQEEGHRHPNTIALEEVERIFIGMGYEVVEGPEVEYDEYNFEKLNIPKGHRPGTSRTPSTSTIRSCCAARHPRFRCAPWSRESFPFA